MTEINWKTRKVWSAIDTCSLRPVNCPDGLTRLLFTADHIWVLADELIKQGIWKDMQTEIDRSYEFASDYKPDDCDITLALETAWAGHISRHYRLFKAGKKQPLRFQDLCTD